MIVREVHTAFEHEVNGKRHIGSFLYLEEVSEWDLEEIISRHRTKIVDPKSLAYLEREQQSVVMAWFLSVDGNFLVLRDLEMDWELREGRNRNIEKLQSQLDGDLMHILRQLRHDLQRNPTLSRKIFRNSGVSRGKLPKRIMPSEMRHMRMEDIHSQLQELDPFNSSDDLLAFAVIQGREKDRWGKDNLKNCKDECERRYKLSGRNQPGIFDLSQVSMAELEARHERGKETLWKFNNMFPAEGCLESRVVADDEWNWQVLEFLRKLSDDVLFELLLVFFAGGIELSSRTKHLYYAATQRLEPHRDF